MFQKATAALALSGLLFSASGCATILRGPKQQILFGSTPARARVWVDGEYIGKTPAFKKLVRKDLHTIKFELDGYEPVEFPLSNRLSHMIWASLILGVGIGLAVDLASGSIFVIEPEDVHKVLKKQVRLSPQSTP